MKLWIAAPLVAVGAFAFSGVAHAEQIFTDVTAPTEPFTVVDSIAMKDSTPQITLLFPNNGYFSPGDKVTIAWDASGRSAGAA